MDILLYMLLDLRKGLCRKIASIVILELWNRVTIGLSSIRGLLVNLFFVFFGSRNRELEIPKTLSLLLCLHTVQP